MNDTTAVSKNEQASRTEAATRDEPTRRNDAALIPPVDVIEDSKGITLRADMPGVVSAEFNQGVLNLRIPKAEHAQPRRIDVKVS